MRLAQRLAFVLIAVLCVLTLAATATAQESMNGVGVAHDPVRNRYVVAHLTTNNALECGIVDAAGNRPGGPVSLSSGICYTPSLARDGDTDRFLAVWGEINLVTESHDVRARFVTSAGVPDGDAFVLASGLSQRPGTHVVYSPHTKRYLVVFSSFTAIEAIWVNADGTPHSLRFDVIPGTAAPGFLYAQAPGVAYDSVNHRFLIAGLLFGYGSPPMSLYGAIVNDTDAVAMYRSPFAILDAATFLYPPALAFDPDHQRYLVAWEQYTGTGHEFWGQILGADGATVAPAWMIDPTASAAFANDVVYRPADGTFLAAWLSGGIVGQAVTPDGANTGSPFTLAGWGYQYDLALTYNPVAGNTLLAYGNTNGSIFVVTPPPAFADLGVTLAAGEQALAGREFSLLAKVTNGGGDPAADVSLVVPLPAGATFVSASASQGAVTPGAGTVTCAVGTLAPGANATLKVVVTAAAPASLVFEASASSRATDTNAANDTASATVSVRGKLAVAPARGTVGAEFEIACDTLGAAKGRVWLVSGKKRIALKILAWNAAGSGVARVRLTRAPAPGVWDVVVAPRAPKGTPPVTETAAFAAQAPQIVTCPDTCRPGETLTLTGGYLGSARGSVRVEYVVGARTKRKAARILAWPGGTTAGSGITELRIAVPRGVPAGAATLVVKNAAGEARASLTVGE